MELENKIKEGQDFNCFIGPPASPHVSATTNELVV
jgi:hypothetical protein